MEKLQTQVYNDLMEDPISKLLIDYYVNVQVNGVNSSELPRFSEISSKNNKSCGISINNIFMLRSIKAMRDIIGGDTISYQDVCYPYEDLPYDSTWTSLSRLEEWFMSDQGTYEQGVSGKDGILFAFDSWINGKDELIEVNDSARIYHNKLVGGEPRSEFMTLMLNLFRYDMKSTLSELVHSKGVGSGTTSQVSEMAFGAMLAGPTINARTYRLRNTKISQTLDVGHFMVYNVGLTEKLVDEMVSENFDFNAIYDPKNRVVDIVEDWKICFDKVRNHCNSLYRSPRDLLDLSRTLIYAEQKDGEKIIRCNFKPVSPEYDENITSYLGVTQNGK